MKKAIAAVALLWSLVAAPDAQCRVAGLPGATNPNQFWTSGTVRGDYAVVGYGGFPGFSPFNLAVANVYLRLRSETPGDPADDVWVLQQTLPDPDGPLTDPPGGTKFPEASFGSDVAIDDDVLLVAAIGYVGAGTVYSYVRDDAGTPEAWQDDRWVRTGKVEPLTPALGISGGGAIDVSGELLAIRDGSADTGTPSGRVTTYFRDRRGTSSVLDDRWTAFAEIEPGGDVGPGFGTAVALDGDRLLVGDYGADAHVYRLDDAGTPLDRSDDSWWREGVLRIPSGLTPSSAFGQAVALDGDRAVVGAYRADVGGAQSGAAYVYRWIDPHWELETRLAPRDGRKWDWFGIAVDIDGPDVVGGAYGDDIRSWEWMGSVTHFRFDEANGWREQARLVPPPSSSAQGWDVALDDGVVLSVPQSASDSYLFLLDDALCATPHAVPVAGDVVNLNVNVGKEHAFEPWILLGSTSGTSPGVALPDGSILPLVGDAFFHWTASGGAGAGMLTVDGLAEISYHLVPPSAGLAGGTIHLAVAVGSFPDGVVEASNPVAVTIAP